MKEKRLEQSLGALWLGLWIALAFYMLVFWPGSHYNSDTSSELLLARLLAREGGILSKNWFYSTELRVLNTQLVTAPLFLLSDNWFLVRVLSRLLLWGILLGSYAFMLHGLGLRRWFWLSAGFLFIPFSHDQLMVNILGAFYIPHIVISFVSLGLFLRIKNSRRPLLVGVSACALAFAAGLGGIRQTAILYAPLFAAALLLFLLCRPSDKKRLWLALACLICSLLGWRCNRMLSHSYHFDTFDQLHFQIDLSSLAKLPGGLMSCFGYNGSTMTGLAALLSLCLAAVVLLLLFLRWQQLNEDARLLLLFFPLALLAITGIYCVTDMHYESRYFLPALVFFFPLLALLWEKKSGCRLTVFLTLCLLLTTVPNLSGHYQSRKPTAHKALAELLLEEGYTQGYASFWNANVLTEYSNGEIEIWTFLERPSNMHEWLQDTRHVSQQPEGRCFLLLEGGEGSRPPWEPFYEDGRYALYSVEDTQQLRQYLYSWERNFRDDTRYVIGGQDIDGVRQLGAGGISYGPYISLMPGQYQICISGSGLDAADFDVCCGRGSAFLPVDIVSRSDTEILYTITLHETVTDVEFRILNNSGGTVSLHGIRATPLAFG